LILKTKSFLGKYNTFLLPVCVISEKSENTWESQDEMRWDIRGWNGDRIPQMKDNS